MAIHNSKQVINILFWVIIISLSACTDHPKQQEGEVAMDTTAGQDNLYIDTTSDISYGIAGEVDTTGSPDLDTLKYINKGVKPEDAFEEK
ncbi:hypothetical protein Q0590_30695 [Rhodocytophaga aerolata]|uniref:Uncharacterized protein n=1 Tax=Rhodocytophaga aerolata TaxID=455078 RepID=A0ABT8RF09_9BACT|nr:hypothetical protein [Rhodocytophaga aerolata]MDO1450682.1 hypothetical protein [Rhodocytophaga aerolata]